MMRLPYNLLIVDIEINHGPDVYRSWPIEIAAWMFYRSGEIGPHYHSLIQCPFPIDPSIKELTGIGKTRGFEDAIPFHEALAELARFAELSKSNVTPAAWGPDIYWLQEFCKFQQITWPFRRMSFDVKSAVTFHSHMTSRSPRVSSLERAIKHFGMTFRGTPHNASDDAFNTALLLQRIMLDWNTGIRNLVQSVDALGVAK